MTAVELHAADFDGRRWPTYRTRRSVAARRLGTPTCVDGVIHRDGYLVRDTSGHVVVMEVAAFEAVYELSSRDD